MLRRKIDRYFAIVTITLVLIYFETCLFIRNFYQINTTSSAFRSHRFSGERIKSFWRCKILNSPISIIPQIDSIVIGKKTSKHPLSMPRNEFTTLSRSELVQKRLKNIWTKNSSDKLSSSGLTLRSYLSCAMAGFWALFLSIKTNLLTCLKQEVQVPVKQEKTISLFLLVTHNSSCLPEQRSLGQFFRWPILAAVPWRKRLCIHWDSARFWSKH